MKKVIALIDMDCFFAQVEQRVHPEFRDRPTAAVYMGFKASQGGGLIALTYDAKARGVSRLMTVGEALKVCPELNISCVPELNGKMDLTRFREASKDVMDVLCRFCNTVEKASVDEWFLDMTELVANRMKDNEIIKPEQLSNTCVTGWQSNPADDSDVKDWLEELHANNGINDCDYRLAVAAVIVEEMRAAIYEETTFRCSAGIAHNKTLAKMGSWLNKPNRQTVIPESSVAALFEKVELKKVRNLGGKVGTTLVEELDLHTMADLQKVSLKRLQEHFGIKTGTWLFDLGQGIDHEVVRPYQLQKSIACSKNFFGKNALSTRQQVQNSIFNLADQVHERLAKENQENKRIAQLMTLTVQLNESLKSSVSRSFAISIYDTKRFYDDALKTLQKLGVLSSDKETIEPPIVLLGLMASKFKDQVTNSEPGIEKFLVRGKSLPESITKTDSAGCSRMHVDYLFASVNSRVPSIKRCVKDGEKLSALEESRFIECSKIDNDEPSRSRAVVGEDSVMCEDCGKPISVWEFPEHADFHVALKLQKELCNSNSENRCSASNVKQMTAQQTTRNNQGNVKKTEIHPPRKKLRCIDSYFTPEKK